MDDTVNEEEPADATPALKAFDFGLGKLTADDRKLLLTTVVGSVAANLATLLLIGSAIALVRWAQQPAGPDSTKINVTTYLIAGFSIATFTLAIIKREMYVRLWGRKVTGCLMVLGAACSLESLLVLVGLAAGIK